MELADIKVNDGVSPLETLLQLRPKPASDPKSWEHQNGSTVDGLAGLTSISEELARWLALQTGETDLVDATADEKLSANPNYRPPRDWAEITTDLLKSLEETVFEPKEFDVFLIALMRNIEYRLRFERW